MIKKLLLNKIKVTIVKKEKKMSCILRASRRRKLKNNNNWLQSIDIIRPMWTFALPISLLQLPLKHKQDNRIWFYFQLMVTANLCNFIQILSMFVRSIKYLDHFIPSQLFSMIDKTLKSDSTNSLFRVSKVEKALSTPLCLTSFMNYSITLN